MIVTVDQAKAHMNIVGDDDNDLITSKIEAAESYVNRRLGFVMATEYAADAAPPDLVEAVLQIIAHWYENREGVLVGVGAQTLPHGVDDIIREHRNWSF